MTDTIAGGDRPLQWEAAATDEPGDQNADSSRRIDPRATSAYYSLGPAHSGQWSVELIQILHGEEIACTALGTHPSEQAAKTRAEQWERG